MTQAPSTPQAVYALIGRTFACDTYEPLYQRSLVARAQRLALSRGVRHSDGRRWHVCSDFLAMPAGLLG